MPAQIGGRCELGVAGRAGAASGRWRDPIPYRRGWIGPWLPWPPMLASRPAGSSGAPWTRRCRGHHPRGAAGEASLVLTGRPGTKGARGGCRPTAGLAQQYVIANGGQTSLPASGHRGHGWRRHWQTGPSARGPGVPGLPRQRGAGGAPVPGSGHRLLLGEPGTGGGQLAEPVRAQRCQAWAASSASSRRRSGQACRPTLRRRPSAAPASSAACSGSPSTNASRANAARHRGSQGFSTARSGRGRGSWHRPRRCGIVRLPSSPNSPRPRSRIFAAPSNWNGSPRSKPSTTTSVLRCVVRSRPARRARRCGSRRAPAGTGSSAGTGPKAWS